MQKDKHKKFTHDIEGTLVSRNFLEFRKARILKDPRILVSETRRRASFGVSDQREIHRIPPLSPHAKVRMRICDTCIRPLALSRNPLVICMIFTKPASS